MGKIETQKDLAACSKNLNGKATVLGLKPKSVWHQSSNPSPHVPVAVLLYIRFLVPASAAIFPQEPCKELKMHILIKCCSNHQLRLGGTHLQSHPPAESPQDTTLLMRAHSTCCACCIGSDLVDLGAVCSQTLPALSSRPRDLEQWLLRPTGRYMQARQPGLGQTSQACFCSHSR